MSSVKNKESTLKSDFGRFAPRESGFRVTNNALCTKPTSSEIYDPSCGALCSLLLVVSSILL